MNVDPVLRDVPVPILTPRLRLEPVNPSFARQHMEALVESKDILRPWMQWIHDEKALDEEARRAWLAKAQAQFILRETLYMQIFERDGGRLVAGSGFHGINWSVPSFEIGYWVRASANGKGYATEITVGLLRYALLALGAKRVAVECTETNDASRRVIEKTEIPFEGLRVNDHRLPDGKVVSTRVYAASDISQVPEMPVQWGPQTTG